MQPGDTLVPVCRAYTLLELWRLLLPSREPPLEGAGSRGPGEKRHETLWTAEEAQRAVLRAVPELSGSSVVCVAPEHPTWTREPLEAATLALDPEAYRSQEAPRWTRDQLRATFAELDPGLPAA